VAKTTYRTGAIGDKRKLLEFFAAKEHRNLVLRIVDVLELRNDHQDWLIRATAQIRKARMPVAKEGTGWRKSWLLRLFPGGHITLPFEELLGLLDMEAAKLLQEICYAYQGVRLSKGEPSRVESCDKCSGAGLVHGQKCKQCDGGGLTTTFLEMSDEERYLARGEDHEDHVG
jgi:hypothetical protein